MAKFALPPQCGSKACSCKNKRGKYRACISDSLPCFVQLPGLLLLCLPPEKCDSCLHDFSGSSTECRENCHCWDLFLGLESRRAWYCSNFVHSSCKSFTRFASLGKSTVGTKTETLFNCRWIGLWYFMISSGGHTDELHLYYPVLTLLCGIRGVDALIGFNCTVSTNASGCLVILVSFGTSFIGSPIFVSQPLGRVPGLLLTPEAPTEGEKTRWNFPRWHTSTM